MRGLLPAFMLAAGLGATPAAAQEPIAVYQRTMADLGTWDAEIDGRDTAGRPFTAHGVEANTVGCTGTCVKSRMSGGLVVTIPGYPGRAWWDDLPPSAVASGGNLASYQTGIASVTNRVSGEYPETRVVEAVPTPGGRASAPGVARTFASRVTIEYPAEGRRVVTFYRTGADGAESRHLRITYTRRK